MWQYYGLVTLSALLVSVQIVFTKCYQRERGSGFFATLMMEIIVCSFFLPFYFISAGGKLEITAFSLLLASIVAVAAVGVQFIGLKVLSIAPLSTYTIFLMLGGLILPTIYGVFCGEHLSGWQIVAILFVGVSMFFTMKKEEDMFSIKLKIFK